MKRESGFYWIRLNDHNWIVAEYNSDFGGWYITGIELGFWDSEIAEINETRIVNVDFESKL